MRRSLTAFIVVAAMSFCLNLQAKTDKAKTDKAPQEAISTDYNTTTAKILNINSANRTLLVEGEDGEKMSVKVDAAVANLDKLKKGDLVVIRHTQSLAITLSKARKGEKPAAEATDVKTQAGPGQKPAGSDIASASISAEVVKVDAAQQWVKLKGPEGTVITLKTKDAKVLTDLKKGDMVAATYTDTVAVSVQPK